MTDEVFRAGVRGFLRALFGCLGGVRLEGLEHIPRSGGMLVAPNHVSHADPLLIGMALDRPVWFVATDELFAIPVLGSLAARLRAFPIRQDSADRDALRRLDGLLRAGEGVVAFPEGHESLDGRLQPLQPGVVWAALRAGVPIVPVHVFGTDRMLPPREWRLRHAGTCIGARFGPPIAADRLAGGLRGRAAVDRACSILTEALLGLAAGGANGE
jgi:1-acyl-sn-glycerol-3-phosphate acyltransferase